MERKVSNAPLFLWWSEERHTISKGFDIGEILGSVNTSWCEGHINSSAGICGSLLHSGSTTQNNEIGQGYLLFFVGRVELVLDSLKLEEFAY